jgi:hypothetical protein
MTTQVQIYTANDAYSRRVDLRRNPLDPNKWQINKMVQAGLSSSWDFSSTGWTDCASPDMMAHGIYPVYNGKKYHPLPSDAMDMDAFISSVNTKNRTE